MISGGSAQSCPRPWDLLLEHDPHVHKLIEAELKRQQNGLEMIASENFVSPQIMCATANPLTNKYAEGLPYKRYYGGCEHIDALEELAIQRAGDLFGARFANVQPHSGASANSAVFFALLDAGDALLGMDIFAGGHLTHGAKVNSSGTLYRSYSYGVDATTHLLDYEAIRQKALEVRPRLIIAGASAYPRRWDFAQFRRIADEVGAYLMVDMAHVAGLIAADLHPSPFPHAHVVTTTTHKTLRGPRGGLILWNDPKLSGALNKGVFPGTQGGPLEHIIAMKAVCFLEATSEQFIRCQKDTIAFAQIFAAELIKRGLDVVSGGTDNHLVLLSLLQSPLSGKQMEEALGHVGITVNKNTVPGEHRSPFETSGVRFGTPALTTRGLQSEDFMNIAAWIAEVVELLQAGESFSAAPWSKIARGVEALCEKYPLYMGW